MIEVKKEVQKPKDSIFKKEEDTVKKSQTLTIESVIDDYEEDDYEEYEEYDQYLSNRQRTNKNTKMKSKKGNTDFSGF